VAKTIKRHWEGVLNYFKSRINNGILEGLNPPDPGGRSQGKRLQNLQELLKVIVYLLTAKLDFSWVQERARTI
jgi:transposase